jgi:hypothetical protein
MSPVILQLICSICAETFVHGVPIDLLATPCPACGSQPLYLLGVWDCSQTSTPPWWDNRKTDVPVTADQAEDWQ